MSITIRSAPVVADFGGATDHAVTEPFAQPREGIREVVRFQRFSEAKLLGALLEVRRSKSNEPDRPLPSRSRSAATRSAWPRRTPRRRAPSGSSSPKVFSRLIDLASPRPERTGAS